jgi:hypothetical protein
MELRNNVKSSFCSDDRGWERCNKNSELETQTGLGILSINSILPLDPRPFILFLQHSEWEKMGLHTWKSWSQKHYIASSESHIT